ncbi:plasmodesmata callose-binding protein 3 [Capsicum annuum]|nr:plasmodesmata callose-binding protein 3 [Capsicum annuum]
MLSPNPRSLSGKGTIADSALRWNTSSEDGLAGSTFTWWNGRIEEDCIFKRLDRVFGNTEFMQTLPNSEAHRLIRQGSNHAHLYVICNASQEQKQNVKLERMPSKEEIKQTVFDLNGDSACGPDGFSGKKKSHFEDLIKKVMKRMSLRQNKLLSFGGRSVNALATKNLHQKRDTGSLPPNSDGFDLEIELRVDKSTTYKRNKERANRSFDMMLLQSCGAKPRPPEKRMESNRAKDSGASYCICKDGVDVKILQENIDYACGSGADCTAIHTNGACYNPDTVKDHCNYAVNSYYQRKGASGASCDFKGTATLTPTAPASAGSGCVYQSTAGFTGVEDDDDRVGVGCCENDDYTGRVEDDELGWGGVKMMTWGGVKTVTLGEGNTGGNASPTTVPGTINPSTGGTSIGTGTGTGTTTTVPGTNPVFGLGPSGMTNTDINGVATIRQIRQSRVFFTMALLLTSLLVCLRV